MDAKWTQIIEQQTGQAIRQTKALSGGCIGDVYRVDLADGRRLVAKVGDGSSAALDIEGYMLRYLREHSRLPVPDVLHSTPRLLLMSFLDGDSHFNAAAERHAADLLAELHSVRGSAYGLERDTLIGGLHQPNPTTDSWIAFFRDRRLRYMAHEAARVGRLPEGVLRRVEQLAGRLDRWLVEPEYPALIHGDMWTTNILAQSGRITGFIDPAIYYADPEIELAFSTLFGTFDRPFFEQYQQRRPLRPGFFEERRDLYNLYPLLVHVRLFGGGYVGSVDMTLRKFGC
jgi:fructosamine-3-kinase